VHVARTPLCPFSIVMICLLLGSAKQRNCEKPYLTCLVNAGWFDRVVGMVVGDLMIDELLPGSEWKAREAREAVLHALDGFNLPILKCNTFGHRPLLNPIVPIGPLCVLDSEGLVVELRESALE